MHGVNHGGEEQGGLAGGVSPAVLEGKLHLLCLHGPQLGVLEQEALQRLLLPAGQRAAVPDPEVAGFLALRPMHLVLCLVQESHHVDAVGTGRTAC